MAYYVGVDLGGTNVRAVVGDDEGSIVSMAKQRTPQGPSGIQVTEAILELIREVCADAGVEPDEIAAAGIASIGPLDLVDGAVEDPANLPDTIDRIPLVGPVENLLDTERVYLHNDTNAGVIGERFYSDRNPEDMVYITISTGIGAGVCVDGHVLSGWDGNAGEVGHMTIDPDGRMECGCGSEGHWEAYCSGNNLPDFARMLYEEDPVETDLPIDDPEFAAPDIFTYAGEDDLADRVIDRLAHWNAMGFANVVQSFAPIVIYVGGAVATHNEELVLDPVRERLDDMVMINVPDVVLTTLGDEVVIKGALASALTEGTGDRSRM